MLPIWNNSSPQSNSFSRPIFSHLYNSSFSHNIYLHMKFSVSFPAVMAIFFTSFSLTLRLHFVITWKSLLPTLLPYWESLGSLFVNHHLLYQSQISTRSFPASDKHGERAQSNLLPNNRANIFKKPQRAVLGAILHGRSPPRHIIHPLPIFSTIGRVEISFPLNEGKIYNLFPKSSFLRNKRDPG